MDKLYSQRTTNNEISALFCELFADNADFARFENLEILMIDFCPSGHCSGYNDVKPSDLTQFAASIPKIFPNLKLLALYGSQRQLLFNESHLNALLNVKRLEQIIDLSLGFEDVSSVNESMIKNILNTFPNLTWLTLETEQILNESNSFFEIVNEAIDARHNLEWITICAAERDSILKVDNRVFIEYWDRNIHQCDFDAALERSKEIIRSKQR